MGIADKTVINIIAQSSAAIWLLVSSIVFTRYLTKADYGTFLQIMLVLNTTKLISFMGLPQSIYYFYHTVADRSKFILNNTLIVILISGSASGFVYWIIGNIAGWFDNPGISEFAILVALLIYFNCASIIREPILISHRALNLNALITFISSSLLFAPAILAAIYGAGIKKILEVMLVCTVIDHLIYLGIISMLFVSERNKRKKISKSSKRNNVSLMSQLRYALPIGFSSYLSIIGTQIDQYIISIFFTPSDYAVYSRGAIKIPFLSTIPFTVNDILMPKYVEAYRNNDTQTFLKYFHLGIEKVAKINFLVFGFLFATASSLITLFFTEAYLGATWVFRCYLFSLILGVAVTGLIPRASGKTNCIVISTIIYLTTNIIFSILFVKIIGAVGAALATIIASIIAGSYIISKSCKILNVTINRIFPWKFLFQLLSVSILASLPVYIIENSYQPEENLLVLKLALEWVIYLYLFIFLSVKNSLIFQDDIDLLNRWLRFDTGKVLQRITFTKVEPFGLSR